MKRLTLAVVALVALAASSTALARVDLDISIGGPDAIYSQPQHFYSPNRYAERPRVERPRVHRPRLDHPGVVILPERIYKRKHVHPGKRYYESYRIAPYRHYQYKHPHRQHHGHHHRPQYGWRN